MRVTQLIYTKEFLKIASKHIFYPEIDYDVKKDKELQPEPLPVPLLLLLTFYVLFNC